MRPRRRSRLRTALLVVAGALGLAVIAFASKRASGVPFLASNRIYTPCKVGRSRPLL